MDCNVKILRKFHKSYNDSTHYDWILYFCRHLYLELRKISRDLNSIFGLQMTVKMVTYFGTLAIGFRDLFNATMLNNYEYKIKAYLGVSVYLQCILVITFLLVISFRLFIINYMCEKVCVKVWSISLFLIYTCSKSIYSQYILEKSQPWIIIKRLLSYNVMLKFILLICSWTFPF